MQVTTINPGQSLVDVGMPEAALTADNLVAVIRNLPANQAAIPAIAHGLKFMDSRAVAFLLKDVAKHGLSHRSVEVFEWLRKLSTTHYLSHLCDVFTYTTGQFSPRICFIAGICAVRCHQRCYIGVR